ncbi:MAG: D-aminoacyl-tRNA deacylase [Eubacteriales bacterium]|nr:D-aminoacyl-tRNA deacylase [Eubacteriales bacterium]MDD3571513.1 D-aminoacyl-tRNA deacylase [Eubacteriales bacterium]MDD4134062.1 D-aminoacyl-tRNA deacylase [Eubacteriales bacterium]
MRAVVQRVAKAAVAVEGETRGSIGPGLVVLLGVEAGDSEKDAAYIAGKIARLRIFEDEAGKMNRSVLDVGGEALLVSQFTLLGDARGQNRPGFTRAEEPERANALYEDCARELGKQGVPVSTGVFRAHMHLSLVNDGPVTILLDSGKLF